jgi:hypothetical protein
MPQPTIPMAQTTESNISISSFKLEIKVSWIDLLEMSDWHNVNLIKIQQIN